MPFLGRTLCRGPTNIAPRVFWLLPLLMLFESSLNNLMIDNLLSEVQIATRMPFAFSLEFKWEAEPNCQTYKIKILKYLWNNSTRLPRILICRTSCLSFQVLSTTSRPLASENPWEFYISFLEGSIKGGRNFPFFLSKREIVITETCTIVLGGHLKN